MKKINIFFLFVLFTIVISLNASSVFAGVATLSWDTPTANADGTPLTDLAGYKVYYGIASGVYGTPINVGNVTTYTVNNLTDGTYYFAATAYNTSGNESKYSNEVSKTVKSTQQYTLSVNKGGTGSGTVTSSPVGINCGSDCSEVYNAGTVVTLTASPSSGSTFTGWSGGKCIGSGTCIFTINENTLLTANFTNTTNASITVTTPKGGERWKIGTTQTIKWTYTGSPGSYVKIELLKNGTVVSTIASSTSIGSNGSGSYTWNIPVKQKSGTYYMIRVTVINTTYKGISKNFTIIR